MNSKPFTSVAPISTAKNVVEATSLWWQNYFNNHIVASNSLLGIKPEYIETAVTAAKHFVTELDQEIRFQLVNSKGREVVLKSDYSSSGTLGKISARAKKLAGYTGKNCRLLQLPIKFFMSIQPNAVYYNDIEVWTTTNQSPLVGVEPCNDTRLEDSATDYVKNAIQLDSQKHCIPADMIQYALKTNGKLLAIWLGRNQSICFIEWEKLPLVSYNTYHSKTAVHHFASFGKLKTDTPPVEFSSRWICKYMMLNISIIIRDSHKDYDDHLQLTAEHVEKTITMVFDRIARNGIGICETKKFAPNCLKVRSRDDLLKMADGKRCVTFRECQIFTDRD